MKQPFLYILTCSLLAVSSMSLAAPVTDQPAKPIKRPSPTFPSSALSGMKEGWVQVSFVVDENGKVQAPVVVDSFGDRGFERQALRALKRWKYQPAIVNGETVASCDNKVQFDYRVGNIKPGASKRSSRLIKQLNDAFAVNDEQTINALIPKLEEYGQNFYEYAYLHYFKAVQAEKQQQIQQQISSLKRATNTFYHPEFEAKVFYLGDAGYALSAKLFSIFVDQGRYAEAIALFDTVQDTHNADAQEAVAVMSAYVDRINAFDGHIPVDVTLSRRGTWLHPLVRQSFTFANVEGQVDSLEIRCDNHYEQFEFAIDNQWNIPQSWGACSVLLKGTPEAKVRLVEVGT